MRDPDLVVRAQQAATALEGAWRRWRGMHGLGSESLPAVSSYVGYSLEAPWGQGRVVLGICAEDAERLAAMLEGHDCVGPVHAAVTAGPAGRSLGKGQANGLPGAMTEPGAAGFVHVPAPAPASAGQQPLSPESAFSRPDPMAGRSYRDPAAASPLTGPSVPYSADAATPIALAASQAVEASLASRTRAVNGSAAARPERADRADEAGALALDHAPDGDDHFDPARPAAGLPVAGLPETPLPGGTRARWADDAAGPDDAGERADAAAITAVGGLPAIPANQPFPWAADVTQSRSTRQWPGERSGEATAGSPAIVPFRPRPELFSHPGSRQQDQGSPAHRDGAASEPSGSDLAGGSRGTRGVSLSTFKRQDPATDRTLAPASGSLPPADLAPAPDHAVAPAAGSAPGPSNEPAEDQAPAQVPGWQQSSRDRISAAAANADAAAWGASELPGQAAVTDTAV